MTTWSFFSKFSTTLFLHDFSKDYSLIETSGHTIIQMI